uniref:Brinker DNA-binding domain-containing protein n=1 Tax=Ditylenchus dipsaci TaxID=166011 RepID=A0A915DPD3_9BILA
MSDQEHEEAESESNVESQEESQKCKLSRKRKAYSLEKKLEAIDYTKKYSKNLAAKKFGVDRARVIEWVKQEGNYQSESLELEDIYCVHWIVSSIENIAQIFPWYV